MFFGRPDGTVDVVAITEAPHGFEARTVASVKLDDAPVRGIVCNGDGSMFFAGVKTKTPGTRYIAVIDVRWAGGQR